LRSTLSRRWNGVTVSHSQAVSDNLKLLPNHQEAVLIQYINKQASRGIYLTPSLLQNIVQHYIGRDINKNWASEFFKRYRSSIRGVYLNGFDRSRHAAESEDNTARFFENVFIIIYTLTV
jgi:hypothetical protein